VVPPGTGVPPLGVVVEEVTGGVVVVGSVSLSVAGFTVERVPAEPSESFESSPATMITAIPRPITRQISRPTIQRVLVATRRI